MLPTIGERVLVRGDNCTIKFVGSIPEWPRDTTIGVEWDNPDRGKNDGLVGGKRYFKTRTVSSGSFFKLRRFEKDAKKSVPFLEALESKYADSSVGDADLSKITFGRKNVQSYGFDDWQAKNADVTRLTTISLDGECVGSDHKVALPTYIQFSVGSSFTKLTALKNLDLSKNLFTCFEDVIKILLKCPQLENLDLSRNNFINDDVFLPEFIKFASSKSSDLKHLINQFSRIKTLNLTSNFLRKSTLSMVCVLFTGLKSANLSDNSIGDDWFFEGITLETVDLDLIQQSVLSDVSKIQGPKVFLDFFGVLKKTKHWESVNLSYNRLTRIPWCLKEAFGESLVALNISMNSITLLRDIGDGKNTVKHCVPYVLSPNHPESLKYSDLSLDWYWKGLKKLDISANHLSYFQEFDILNCKFPDLADILVNENKAIYSGELEEYFKQKYEKSDQALSFEDFLIDELFYSTVFRFGENLKTFNKSAITFDERTSSELYYLSKAKEEPTNSRFFLSEFAKTRFQEICEKYHIDHDSDKSNTTDECGTNELTTSLRSHMIDLTLRVHRSESDVVSISQSFFDTVSLLQMKGVTKSVLRAKTILDLRFFFTMRFETENGPVYKTEEMVNNEDELFQYGLKSGDTVDVYLQ